MNSETGTFTSMDTYANANLVMYTDPSGYFSLAELSVAQQVRLIFAGEVNKFGLVVAIAKGMITQTLIYCVAKALLGEAATMVLKVS